MSSPIHSFLFSPPPSPPRRSSTDQPSRGLTSFRSLLLPLQEHAESQARDDKPRSPSLQASPASYHSPRLPASPLTRRATRPVLEVRTVHSPAELDAIAKAANSPIPIILEPASDSKLTSEGVNVPTLASGAGALPRPVVRLITLCALMLASISLLVLVPGARLPSLRDAAAVHRLVLNPDGASFIDSPLSGHQAARDRDYVPPQISIGRSSRLTSPARKGKAHAHAVFSHLSSSPKVAAPAAPARPIPHSHELLAVQSWLLQSPFNSLPPHVDAKLPIDAVAVTGFDVGPDGSKRRTEWLAELEREGKDDVIIWFGMDGHNTRPEDLIGTIKSYATSYKTPSLLPIAPRADLPKLNALLTRLGFSLAHPLLVINNVAISVSPEKLRSLDISGELEAMLVQAGWGKSIEEKDGRSKRRKLKQAKQVRKDPSELELLGMKA